MEASNKVVEGKEQAKAPRRQAPAPAAGGGSPWLAFAVFSAVIAAAMILHAVGSVSRVAFVYGGL